MSAFGVRDTWRDRSRPQGTRDFRKGLDRTMSRLARRSVPGVTKARFHALARTAVDGEGADRKATDAELRTRAGCCAELFALGRDDDSTMIETLRVVREAARRTLNLHPYPVQLAAGVALAQGQFVELATGEGKTLVATIPALIGAWRGPGCHVLTSNDYLAERDAGLNSPLFAFFGVRTSRVTGPMGRDDRRDAYRHDIVYTTAKEACADHLRDRMLFRGAASVAGSIAGESVSGTPLKPVQRGLWSCVVDEADSLCIDEAVTPLVISTRVEGGEESVDALRADTIASSLVEGQGFTVDAGRREIALTRNGQVEVAERSAGWGGIWAGPNRRAELVTTALTARTLYLRDREYIVDEGSVVIVDTHTGRTMPDRTWQHLLHRAVEAKESVESRGETRTEQSLSFQRFFARYEHLCGMSGTLREVASEIATTYRARTVCMSAHRPCVRSQERTVVFARSEDRWNDVVDRVRVCRETKRPVLVGTRSVRSSELLSGLLDAAGIEHRVLNALHHDREAEIIAKAGNAGCVTVATSMAGRGTDIMLTPAARSAGGLHVIVAEMHDAARVDRQLLGRAGRQGDPGSGVVLGSLEDELITRFGPRALVSLARATGTVRVSPTVAQLLVCIARTRSQGTARTQRALLTEQGERFDDALALAER